MSKNHTIALRNHSISMIGLLVVQYLLGTYAGFFVEFPEDATVSEAWKFAMGNWIVMLHIVVGTLVVVGLVGLYVRAVMLKDRTWQIAGAIAAGSSVLSWLCGEEFIAKQSDMYSFAMAVFFMIALLALGWGVYKSRS